MTGKVWIKCDVDSKLYHPTVGVSLPTVSAYSTESLCVEMLSCNCIHYVHDL